MVPAGRRRVRLLPPALLALALAAIACSDPAPRAAAAPARPAAGADADPLRGLQLDADAVAARVGSFSWGAEVRWSVEKPGAAPVHVVEHHEVRQLATGEFEASSDIDPGGGPGSETGKRVVYTGGMTYARGRWAPPRERSNDRGHEARRFRDESFQIANDLAALFGPALTARPAGETSLHHRRARRYELSLSPAAAPPASATAARGTDPDTARRLAFLDGRVPTSASGELIVDAATGVPLAASLRGSFTQRSDPELKAEVEVTARVRSLGRDVAPVHPPAHALPDERKPKGVARALEAAGLRKHAAPEPEREDEASDEP